MNPHGFPSRMTVGKMIELVAGKAGVFEGRQGERDSIVLLVIMKSKLIDFISRVNQFTVIFAIIIIIIITIIIIAIINIIIIITIIIAFIGILIIIVIVFPLFRIRICFR